MYVSWVAATDTARLERRWNMDWPRIFFDCEMSARFLYRELIGIV
jgi:hypothetical protein